VPAEDDDLLERLEDALRPAEATPSQAEVAALRRAVAEGDPAPVVHRVWPRRVLAGAVAAAILLFIVSGAALPRPLRTVAHALRLPVDSVEVADARSAEKELRAALDGGDGERIARASERMQRRLEALREGDRERFGRRVNPYLERARAGQVPAPGAPVPARPLPSPASTTSSTARTSTTTPTQSTSTTTTTTGRTSTTSKTTSTSTR
jgi:hypothetical protein